MSERIMPREPMITSQDVVTTGDDGHTFLKLDAGMTEVRPRSVEPLA